MKALLVALLLAAGLLCPCAHAQQDEATRSRFLAVEAKAKQGDARAQYSLGVCYYDGYGVAYDFVEAVKWFRKAAEQGDARAQFMLGVYHGNSYGVAYDLVAAVKWYRKAAEQGDADGQFNVGVCYYQGNGVEKYFVEAVYWYRKAAAQGHARGQSMLGVCYYYGEGVRQDLMIAEAWWNLALKTNKNAAERRSDLEAEMSPQQVVAAQKRRKELRAIVEAKAAK